MDILKEKIRIDKAEAEEHVQTVKAHDESISKMHDTLVQTKADMSESIREESASIK
jgi:outer membrane lipoprotein-sorting protein